MPSSAPASNEPAIAVWLDRYFRGQGFSGANLRATDAAFLGNWQVEAGWNPAAYNPNEGAHGIGQWEGGRYTAGLLPYSFAHHLDPNSLAADLGYAGQELSGPYSSVVAALRGVTDPRQAAQIVQSQYEGSTTASLGARQADAQAAYNWLGGGINTGLAGITDPGGGGSSTSGSAPALPYALGSLSGNLNATQRTNIINYLEAVGNAPAAIGQWIVSNLGPWAKAAPGAQQIGAGNFGAYEQGGAAGNQYDQYLLDAYNAIGAGGGIGYGAGHLSYQWHMPGSGIVGDITAAVTSALEGILGWVAKPLLKWALAALLVIAGLIFVYLAVKMLGEGDDGSSSTPAMQPSTSTRTDDEEAETPRSEGPAVDTEGAEVAAAGA